MTGISLNVLSFLLLGFFLGMRHATDADHVVAIATIVSRERSMTGSALIGAAWGVGHTLTVMAVGAAIIVFGVVIPPRLGLSMEFAVGIMLVVLGVLTLSGKGPGRGEPPHVHAHGSDGDHTPPSRPDRHRLERIAIYRGLRPFAVGIVHGLAGSAAAALMVLSVIHDRAAGLGYLLLFCLGT